jgi:elongator complex protein 3
MPKSYLRREPGAQRAARHGFDPFEQAHARLQALSAMGHPTDKIELIVLGGTWTAYPKSYQRWFVRRAFEALNQTRSGPLGQPAANPPNETREPWTADSDEEAQAKLVGVHHENETARCRCVGLTVETRPDAVTPAEVVELRSLGVTRVQVGYQHVSDRVLALNQRDHTVSDSRRATELLRSAAFKIQAHWMANLYGASPEQDLEDFSRLFDDPGLSPDELKIYPTSLVAGTPLWEHYAAGRWRPYGREELVELLCGCLARVPPYCRISRVIRDIPGNDILVGQRVNGLRDWIETELRRRGTPCRDIRSREIGRRPVDGSSFGLDVIEYFTTTSRELFLQLLTDEGHLGGFLRLSLPRTSAPLPELAESALIRELHVYGSAARIGGHAPDSAQHSGLGRRLVSHASSYARRAGYASLAVISAVGTRAYYRRLGFVDKELYQHRPL